jgi:hypothetical protein
MFFNLVLLLLIFYFVLCPFVKVFMAFNFIFYSFCIFNDNNDSNLAPLLLFVCFLLLCFLGLFVKVFIVFNSILQIKLMTFIFSTTTTRIVVIIIVIIMVILITIIMMTMMLIKNNNSNDGYNNNSNIK